MTPQELATRAIEAMAHAYAPYSDYTVGAALLTASGQVYTGCNIENAAYTPTVCAERTALFKAVSEGEREFLSIAIVGGKGKNIADFCAPCGVCRQALAEFCEEDFRVLLGTPENFRAYTFAQLLPFAFGKGDLAK